MNAPSMGPFQTPTQPTQDFQTQFRHECVQGSAIAPELFESSIEFTEDTGQWEIHTLLGWKLNRFWQYRRPHDFGVFGGFYQENGDLWQGKAEHAPLIKGKASKYLAIKGIGATAYLPPLPASIRTKLGIPHSGSAWEQIAAASKIPLVLTEGGKKGLCGLSHGYATVAGFGMDAFSQKGKRTLLPELMPFVHPQRRWLIALDEDAPAKKRRRLRKATHRLARLLTEAGVAAQNIFIVQWNPEQGKGLDDLVVQCGAEALHQAVAQALPYPEWKRGGFKAYLQGRYPQLFGLTKPPTIELRQKYLPALKLPPAGGILAISSPMGSGKTEAMKGLIAQAKALAPDCLIELIGYRNSLGMQSAQRLGLAHIHDLQGSDYAQAFIQSEQGLAYCLDSLHRRIEAVYKGIARGQRVLVLLDEVDAVLKHLFLGSTLRPRRGTVASMFCELLQAVAQSGGWIVAGEAELHALPILVLESITGQSATVIVNHDTARPWSVEAPMPTNLKGQPSAALMGPAAIARILHMLKQGQRVVAPTDSQQWGEKLERLAAEQGVQVLRLDGQTSEEQWAQTLMQAPDAYLAQATPALFIYTPTAESGLSITGEHFDAMISYASHLEHRALLQLMGRVRTTLPRVVYCRESGFWDQSGRGMDPESLLQDWQLNARYSLMMAHLGDEAPTWQWEGLTKMLHGFAAQYQARCHLSQSHLRASLLQALVTQGHHVIETEELPLNPTFRSQLKTLQVQLQQERTQDFIAADTAQMLPEKARQILHSTTSHRTERLQAQKVLLLESYPGLPLDDTDFVQHCIIEAQSKRLRQHTALFLALYPDVAQAMDRLAWQSQNDNTLIWLPDIKHEAPKALLVRQSGLLELFQNDEYYEDSPRVQRVREFAIHYQADIKRLLGLWCDATHSGIQIVNKLAKKLGMVSKILRKRGPRGAQTKIWGWHHQHDDDRQAIFTALKERWSQLLNQIQPSMEHPVALICDQRKPLSEIEATDSLSWGNLSESVQWQGSEWRVKSINNQLATLIHPNDWAQVPLIVPVADLVPVI